MAFFWNFRFLEMRPFLDIFSQYGVLCNFSRFFTCEWSHLFPIFLSLPKSIPEMKEHIFCAKLQYEFPKCSRSFQYEPFFSLSLFYMSLKFGNAKSFEDVQFSYSILSQNRELNTLLFIDHELNQSVPYWRLAAAP